jgi:hypothetical protein
MSARIFALVRRKLPRKPLPVFAAPVLTADQTHGRSVKNFVEQYSLLQQSCSQAQSRNNQAALADFIDQMKALERRVRFVPDGAP